MTRARGLGGGGGEIHHEWDILDKSHTVRGGGPGGRHRRVARGGPAKGLRRTMTEPGPDDRSRALETLSEDELLDAVRAGDTGVYAELYRRHQIGRAHV